MLSRAAFLVIFSGQLNTVSAGEIVGALWLGLRLSLKTAGFFALPAFILGTLPALAVKKWPTDGFRRLWGSWSILFLTFLFMARIPYYKIYNQGFNMMLLNGVKDDQKAILATALQEYQLVPRLVGVLLLAAALIYLWRRWLQTPVWQPRGSVKPYVIGFIFVFPIFFFFCRFGGAFNSDNGIHWESAARTKSNLLNEAILDDGQALYRVWSMHKRDSARAQAKISPEKLQQDVKLLGGDPQAAGIDQAFLRHASGKNLVPQPQTVVVIFGENYALWPLLPPYLDLGLAGSAEKMREQGAATYHFLANGNGTMTSLNGLLTGLPDVGLYPNYHQQAGKQIYGLGIGAALKKAGYKTCFWYGGLGSWQDLKAFTLRDGFDEFHCADEMPEQGQNSWGVPDEALFAAVERYMAQDKGKTFHFILTTSNHPPFEYDVDSKGFPRAEVAAKLPPSLPKDKATLNQLGHIWYADREIGKFTEAVQKMRPDALFVLTGDHAERFSFATQVSLEENSGIPCIFYGRGVKKDLLPPTAAGSHLQIAPTLCELLLPAGSDYYSLLPPLMHSEWAFNHRLVMVGGKMEPEQDLHNEQFLHIINAAREISVWRVLQGDSWQGRDTK